MLNQLVFNLIIKQSINGIYFKFLLKLREILLLLNPNAIIKYKYNNSVELLFPFSHDYPINKKKYPKYSENLGVIASIIIHKYAKAKVIDVGANIGDSAAIINYHSKMPVLCVEGNPKFFHLLETNIKQFSKVEISKNFVGEINETVNTINYGGTARIEKAESGIEVKTLDEILSLHHSFLDSKLIKIDTDGFDFKVIRASKNLLLKTKPILFFEFDPFFLITQNENPISIFNFLKDLGYSRLLLFDNLGSFVFELDSSQKEILNDLSIYYNRGGVSYLDICAINEIDDDLIPMLKKAFQAN